jgi:hypothetical protein
MKKQLVLRMVQVSRVSRVSSRVRKRLKAHVGKQLLVVLHLRAQRAEDIDLRLKRGSYEELDRRLPGPRGELKPKAAGETSTA